MKPIPAAPFRFSITALLLLTACAAFLASSLIERRQTEPPRPALIATTLALRGNTPLVDSIDGTPSIAQAEMERLMERQESLIYQSLAAAIATALGDGTDDVVVTRVSRTSPTEPLAIDATWRGSSETHTLTLRRIDSNLYLAFESSPDGSPDLALTLDVTGTFLDDDPDTQNSR